MATHYTFTGPVFPIIECYVDKLNTPLNGWFSDISGNTVDIQRLQSMENERREKRGREITRLMPESVSRMMGACRGSQIRLSRSSRTLLQWSMKTLMSLIIKDRLLRS